MYPTRLLLLSFDRLDRRMVRASYTSSCSLRIFRTFSNAFELFERKISSSLSIPSLASSFLNKEFSRIINDLEFSLMPGDRRYVKCSTNVRLFSVIRPLRFSISWFRSISSNGLVVWSFAFCLF